MLSSSIRRATFTQRRDFVTVNRIGYISLDFIPQNPEYGRGEDNGPRFMHNKRETFLLGYRNIAEILSIDVRAGNEVELEFFFNDNETLKKVNITGDGNQYHLGFAIEYKESGEKLSFSNKLSMSDMLMFQKMVDYAYPIIFGWNSLYTPSVVEQDIGSEFDY